MIFHLFKRICLVAMLCSLATVPVGCSDSNDDPAPTPAPEPQPDPEPEPETTAIVFAPDFVDCAVSETIGVFAFDTDRGVWNDNALPNLMADQLLGNDNGTWSYDPTQTWPEGARISYFAYAPHATADNGLSVTDAAHRGAPRLTYEIPSAEHCHTDILIALPRKDLECSDDPIALEFRSVMAKIGFRVQGHGERISRIAVRGIQNKGEVSLDLENGDAAAWTPGNEYATTEYELGLRCDDGADYATAAEEMTDLTAEEGFLYLMPQNLTYNARIIVTVDGEKIGFPFENLFQIAAGQEYYVDLVIPADKPLDYTDNASSAFLIAPTDAAEAANISWADATTACEAAGYRLPTYNEGLMILFYMNGIENNNFRYASYWCSTTSKEDMTSDNAMGYNIMP